MHNLRNKKGLGIAVALLYLISSVLLPLTSPLASAATSTCDPSIELVQNGSFESPVVTHPASWDIFASGDPALLGWKADWISSITTYNGETRPAVANIELQHSIHDGWGYPYAGAQYAELDTDWKGPNFPSMSYPSSIDLYQTIATIPGNTYTLSFAFSPRPDDSDLSDNSLKVSWNGSVIDTVTATSVDPTHTSWSIHTYNVTATGTSTRIDFADNGHPNAIGTFIDGVSAKCATSGSGGGTGGGGGGGTSTSATSSLKVIKLVVNSNGGVATSSDFTLTASGNGISTTSATTSVTSVSFPGSALGVFLTLVPGTYSVDETASSTYTKSLSADCSGIIASGEAKVCTITNTQISPVTGGGGGGGGTTGGGGGGGGVISGPLSVGFNNSGTPSTNNTGGGIVLGTSTQITPPGVVLGTSTENVPGLPNTGAGGNASTLISLLAISFVVFVGSAGSLLYRSRR